MTALFWIGYAAMAATLGLIYASTEVGSLGTMYRLRRAAVATGSVMLLTWALIVGIRFST